MKGMYWTTRNGQQLEVKTMGSSHIENCLKIMERNGQENSPMWFYMSGILDGREEMVR